MLLSTVAGGDIVRIGKRLLRKSKSEIEVIAWSTMGLVLVLA